MNRRGEASGGRSITRFLAARRQPSWFNPATVKGIAGISGGLLVLYAPDQGEELVGLIVAIGLVVTGFSDLWFKARGRGVTRYRGVGEAVLAIVAGLVLLAWPQLTLGVLALTLSIYLIVRGSGVALSALRARRQATRWGLDLSRGMLFVALGTIGLIIPGALQLGLFASLAVVAVVVGTVMLTYGLRSRTDEELVDLDAATVSQIMIRSVRDRDVGDPRREEIGSGLFFEGPDSLGKLASWWVMLLLSVAIATFGVMQDSTAVVIGAMLIAPLMTPILGTAAGIANAWPRRVAMSIGLVALGVAAAVGLAFILGQWLPTIVPLSANSQITSRVNPNLVDMLIALAAGAAGAYATVNRRVSASIAGVAIAVALVPPLAVVGLNLQAHLWTDAWGAFLLFLTNFVSIILAAVLVFLLTGYMDLDRLERNRDQVIGALTTVVIAGLVILVPLVFTVEGVVSTASRQQSAQEAVDAWLGPDTQLTVTSVIVDGADVEVLLSGTGDVPALAELGASLTAAFGSPASIRVEYTPTQVQLYSSETGPVELGGPEPHRGPTPLAMGLARW